MSQLPKRVGHAEQEVLFKLIDLAGQIWFMTGPPLYESREFTVALLERLIRRDFVTQTGATYRPTRAGIRWTERQSTPR